MCEPRVIGWRPQPWRVPNACDSQPNIRLTPRAAEKGSPGTPRDGAEHATPSTGWHVGSCKWREIYVSLHLLYLSSGRFHQVAGSDRCWLALTVFHGVSSVAERTRKSGRPHASSAMPYNKKSLCWLPQGQSSS